MWLDIWNDQLPNSLSFLSCPDKWEIDPSELSLLEEVGSGQFGVRQLFCFYSHFLNVEDMKNEIAMKWQ